MHAYKIVTQCEGLNSYYVKVQNMSRFNVHSMQPQGPKCNLLIIAVSHAVRSLLVS